MSGTARRLLSAFSLLVLAFGAAAYAALEGMAEIHEALHSVRRQETAVRTTLSLATSVRDLYAHQAHTVILGNASHLPLYDSAYHRAMERLEAVQAQATTSEERAQVETMRRTTTELDRLFREALVPAVLREDHATAAREHARALELVDVIQESADTLASHYERAIGNFEEHASTVQHASFQWTVAILAAAALLAAGVGLYIGRSVARPVSLLEAGAARIAAGDLMTRIALDRPDEFGRLAQQFNRMTAALREHQERLVQSERLAGIGRLAAGVAHEINNPLGVILGYVRLLQRKAEGALADDLRIIEEETLRCRDIVEGMLDLSRPLQVPGETLELRELVEEVVSRQRESAQLSAASLTVEGEARVAGHPQRLRQVVTNLVKNAMEAAGPSGQVTVAIHAHDDEVALSFRDSGPGLSPEAQKRMFEPFFTTKPHGTGLGLAVSQAIAQAHGGRIQPRNLPGRGAEFTLHLPRSTP
ncbi:MULTISPECIES: sensor histidine kinase [unclassified Myxococcus]|uniref:sensor histidine kinase n=1 Tax=unclassified Myxococcus TaxID=2648731 RepID=UPI00114790B9|nr:MULTISPECIES: HAMP domain-containing sensor histidine kinase [unclassified Myxococcus]